MFEIVYSLIFDFIDMLKWWIPLTLLFMEIGVLLRGGK